MVVRSVRTGGRIAAMSAGLLAQRPDPVEAVSVGELVRRRTGGSADPWQLALVQRNVVWDEVRMARFSIRCWPATRSVASWCAESCTAAWSSPRRTTAGRPGRLARTSAS